MLPDGNRVISCANDKVVWDMLYQALEIRMQNGEFTVIDATNSKTSEMQRYKELAENYRYRMYCIDMTDIPIDEVKRRNANREELKQFQKLQLISSTQNLRHRKFPLALRC